MSDKRSPYDGLDLSALTAMWESRARAVSAACQEIDIARAVRPPRDPFEREWLIASGRSDAVSESYPLTEKEVIERTPTRRRR